MENPSCKRGVFCYTGAMSTKLGFREPKNFLTYTAGDTFLSAEYTTVKTRLDKKTVANTYMAYWTLSAVVNEVPRLIGSMKTPVDAYSEDEAIGRMDYLSDYVAQVITAASKANPDVKEEILTDLKGREIVAAAHAKWHSSSVHGVEMAEAATVLRNFIIEFGVKNVKKVLAEVLDAKVESV
jgi:hypothetical protein